MGVGIGKTGALLRWMAWASEGDERGEVLWMVDVREGPGRGRWKSDRDGE